jgi:hypothetical protein
MALRDVSVELALEWMGEHRCLVRGCSTTSNYPPRMWPTNSATPTAARLCNGSMGIHPSGWRERIKRATTGKPSAVVSLTDAERRQS